MCEWMSRIDAAVAEMARVIGRRAGKAAARIGITEALRAALAGGVPTRAVDAYFRRRLAHHGLAQAVRA